MIIIFYINNIHTCTIQFHYLNDKVELNDKVLLCHFFCLLWVGEFTANTYKDESDRPLQIKDIRLLATPPRIQITIRGLPGEVVTSVTGGALACPVYLAVS
jgi:hypothetical protein